MDFQLVWGTVTRLFPRGLGMGYPKKTSRKNIHWSLEKLVVYSPRHKKSKEGLTEEDQRYVLKIHYWSIRTELK